MYWCHSKRLSQSLYRLNRSLSSETLLHRRKYRWQHLALLSALSQTSPTVIHGEKRSTFFRCVSSSSLVERSTRRTFAGSAFCWRSAAIDSKSWFGDCGSSTTSFVTATSCSTTLAEAFCYWWTCTLKEPWSCLCRILSRFMVLARGRRSCPNISHPASCRVSTFFLPYYVPHRKRTSMILLSGTWSRWTPICWPLAVSPVLGTSTRRTMVIFLLIFLNHILIA